MAKNLIISERSNPNSFRCKFNIRQDNPIKSKTCFEEQHLVNSDIVFIGSTETRTSLGCLHIKYLLSSYYVSGFTVNAWDAKNNVFSFLKAVNNILGRLTCIQESVI